MTEYAVRLANDSNVHSIQLDDGLDVMIPNSEYFKTANEITLDERLGRMHHSYVRGDGVIKKMNDCLVYAMEEPNRNVF